MKNGSTNAALPYKQGYLYTLSRLPPTLCVCRRRGGSVVRRCCSRTHTCTSLCPDILTQSSRRWHVPLLEVVHTSLLNAIQSKDINLQCCESTSYYVLFLRHYRRQTETLEEVYASLLRKQTVRTHIAMLVAVI